MDTTTNPFAGVITCDSYTRLALLFAGIVVCAVTVSLLAIFIFNRLLGLGLDGFEITSFAQGSVYTLACLQALRLLGVDPRAAWADWRRGFPRDLWTALKYFGVYVLLTGGMVALAMVYIHLTGKPAAEALKGIAPDDSVYVAARSVMHMSPLRFIFMLLSICVLAPIGEELFFRRLVYSSLRKKLRFLPALFLSSSIFAATHVSSALLVFPVSLLLGYVYEKERRLPVNICLHALVNAFVLLFRLT